MSDFLGDMKEDEGLHFECNGCSQCCRFEGGVVLLSEHDLNLLAQWAELTPDQFIQVYCRWLLDNEGNKYLALRDKSNSGDCIFWDASIPGCQAYTARPTQCRTYPFWTNIMTCKERWDLEKHDCPGINCGPLHTKKEMQEQLSLYESRTPIIRKKNEEQK